jgi:hypothetical protein
MLWTAEESVRITSAVSGLEGFFAVKMASKASALEGGGTVVETEIGR